MKIILFLFCICLVAQLQAQHTKDSLNQQKEVLLISPGRSSIQDTSKRKVLRDSIFQQKESNVSELFIIGKKAYKKGKNDSTSHYSSFKGHWSGFYYGFINYARLPEAWEKLELDWNHSFAMQFNFCKYNINLSKHNNFGLVSGIGIEYQRLRFNNDNISLLKSEGKLEIIHPLQEYPKINKIKRSTFKNLYLTIPLLMEVLFPANSSKKMYVSGGIMGGLRIHSKTKIVYEDDNDNKHKKKNKGSFNMGPFKADAIARIGYRKINIWGSYTLTNTFKNKDLHLYTAGLGLTF